MGVVVVVVVTTVDHNITANPACKVIKALCDLKCNLHIQKCQITT